MAQVDRPYVQALEPEAKVRRGRQGRAGILLQVLACAILLSRLSVASGDTTHVPMHGSTSRGTLMRSPNESKRDSRRRLSLVDPSTLSEECDGALETFQAYLQDVECKTAVFNTESGLNTYCATECSSWLQQAATVIHEERCVGYSDISDYGWELVSSGLVCHSFNRRVCGVYGAEVMRSAAADLCKAGSCTHCSDVYEDIGCCVASYVKQYTLTTASPFATEIDSTLQHLLAVTEKMAECGFDTITTCPSCRAHQHPLFSLALTTAIALAYFMAS